MRVLYLSRSLSVHDRRFLTKLKDWGYHVAFACLRRPEAERESVALPTGVEWVRWAGDLATIESPGGCPQLVPAFRRVMRDVAPDIIHAGPVQTCGFLAALSGARPLVTMSWGFDMLIDAERDMRWLDATRFVLQRSDRVVCDCTTVRCRIREIGDVPDEVIVQLPWGTDLDVFVRGPDAAGIRAAFGDASVVVALSVRPWEPPYGTEVLVEAFARAHAQDPRLRLVLLGAGSLADRVRGVLAQHLLAESVQLPGLVSHVQLPNYYRAADVYMSCAPQDGTSVSLLEAMATGLPVLVTDNPSNREWVRGGENGFLAPAGEPDAFAEGLLRAASLDPAEREQVARRNRGVAERRADWKRNALRLRDVYAAIGSTRVAGM